MSPSLGEVALCEQCPVGSCGAQQHAPPWQQDLRLQGSFLCGWRAAFCCTGPAAVGLLVCRTGPSPAAWEALPRGVVVGTLVGWAEPLVLLG